MEMETQKLRRVVRQRDLHEFDGLGRTQRQVLIDRGEYPAPIRTAEGGRAKFWLVDELAQWQEQRIAAGRISPPRIASERPRRAPEHVSAKGGR
jgi:predicted DNA-binding transcriptional regulator AlpA